MWKKTSWGQLYPPPRPYQLEGVPSHPQQAGAGGAHTGHLLGTPSSCPQKPVFPAPGVNGFPCTSHQSLGPWGFKSGLPAPARATVTGCPPSTGLDLGSLSVTCSNNTPGSHSKVVTLSLTLIHGPPCQVSPTDSQAGSRCMAVLRQRAEAVSALLSLACVPIQHSVHRGKGVLWKPAFIPKVGQNCSYRQDKLSKSEDPLKLAFLT